MATNEQLDILHAAVGVLMDIDQMTEAAHLQQLVTAIKTDDWMRSTRGWVHVVDLTHCTSGPALPGDTHCLDHDRAVKKE